MTKSRISTEPLVVDSTGLKLYGEGEWKVRKHGADKRRTWLKLHLGINEATHDIEACILTGDDVHDSEALPAMLNQIDGPIDQITGDGAYDNHGSYQAAINSGADPCFRPRKDAVRNKPTDEAWRLRNQAVSQVHYGSVEIRDFVIARLDRAIYNYLISLDPPIKSGDDSGWKCSDFNRALMYDNNCSNVT